jgi:hypothetical protein
MGRISAESRHFLIAYILLVGLPLLGLAGVLKIGQRVSAPISVDGVWKLDLDAKGLVSGPCSKQLASLQASSMTISQSGKNLVLALDAASKNAAAGNLEGSAFNGNIPLDTDAAADAPACGKNSVLAVVATVDPKTEPRFMTGTIAVTGCSSCTPIKYRAVRENRSRRRDSH